MEAFNHSLFLTINSLAGHSTWLDMTGIAIGEGLQYLFIAFEIWLYFFAKRREEALLAFYAVLLGLGLNTLAGLVYFHPRPFMDGLGVKLVHHGANNSFPSDHTTFLASIAFTFLFLPGMRRWGVLMVFLSILGGLARVFEGVHYPMDIAGSLIFSTVAAAVVVTLSSRLKPVNRLIYRIQDFLVEKIADARRR